MSSSLVLELQHAAASADISVTELLRKSVVVAAKLDISGFRAWSEAELAGYSATAQVPGYRRVRGELRARNPYHGWIPVLISDSGLYDTLEMRSLRQSVGELEDLYRSAGSTDVLRMPLPNEVLMGLFGGTPELQAGMVPVLLFGRSALGGILDAVRNEVLRWSLELEREGVLGEGMTFSADEKARAARIEYHIGTFSGVLGDVNASQVQIGDYTAIHGQLRLAGVPQGARNEIEDILDELKTGTPDSRPGLVQRGMEWLAKYGPAIGALSETIRGWLTTVRGP